MSEPHTLETYPAAYVRPTSKADVMAYLDRIRARVEEYGPELTSFPEGAAGVVLYNMVADEAESCPDVGDFALAAQAYTGVLQAAVASLTNGFRAR